jgi:hypothetical protein
MSAIARPAAEEYAPHFERYVARVPEVDIVAELDRQGTAWGAFLAAAKPELAGHRYAPDKWTVRQVIAHIIDTERVMAYRAMCIARGETEALPGMDEDAYMARTGPDPATLAALGEEFAHLRRATTLLCARFAPEVWLRRGIAAGQPASVRGLAYVMVGHVRHHGAVLAERYALVGVPA